MNFHSVVSPIFFPYLMLGYEFMGKNTRLSVFILQKSVLRNLENGVEFSQKHWNHMNHMNHMKSERVFFLVHPVSTLYLKKYELYWSKYKKWRYFPNFESYYFCFTLYLTCPSGKWLGKKWQRFKWRSF